MSETDKFKQFNQLYMLDNKELTHEQAAITGELIADELQEFLREFFRGALVVISNVTLDKVSAPNLHNAFKELEDIRYITGQQMTELGGDVTKIGNEVHASNVSKQVSSDDIVEEMSIAAQRYPDVVDFTLDCETFVMKCNKTGKVIKPTTYSPAIITDEMVGL